MSESDDDWSPSCWDCERELPRRHLNMYPVHIDHDDGIGYERVDVPLCDGCRKDRMHTHECDSCGREWINVTDAITCCPDHARRPFPDGGTKMETEQPTPISWQEWVDDLSMALEDMWKDGEYQKATEYALADLPDSEYGRGSGPHLEEETDDE